MINFMPGDIASRLDVMSRRTNERTRAPRWRERSGLGSKGSHFISKKIADAHM